MAARKFNVSGDDKVNHPAEVKKLTAMLFLSILHTQNPGVSRRLRLAVVSIEEGLVNETHA